MKRKRLVHRVQKIYTGSAAYYKTLCGAPLSDYAVMHYDSIGGEELTCPDCLRIQNDQRSK